MADDVDLAVVFEGTIVQADLARCRLEMEGIHAFIENEVTSFMAPFYINPGSIGSVRVIVAAEDKEKAEEILADSPSEPDES